MNLIFSDPASEMEIDEGAGNETSAAESESDNVGFDSDSDSDSDSDYEDAFQDPLEDLRESLLEHPGECGFSKMTMYEKVSLD